VRAYAAQRPSRRRTRFHIGVDLVLVAREVYATRRVRSNHSFFSSRRRHTRSVSAFLLNRSSDLEMTRKVSAEVDLVHQQTQNQRYGSSHIGATAKDISNVVTDAASGVVDIFHGIDKAVADTWNNFWKDGKADGIGSNLSR